MILRSAIIALLTLAIVVPSCWAADTSSLPNRYGFKCHKKHTENAGPGCHLKVDTAIYCFDPRAAAIVYDRFGMNTDETKQSHIRQLLHEAGCGLIFNARNALIEEIGHGRTATANGWADIMYITIDGSTAAYVATPYIEGKCHPNTPEECEGGNFPVMPTAPKP